jgi:deoxyribodipyrimidine photo-lyase
MNPFPPLRVRDANKAPIRSSGDFVLYWMIAYRRPLWNYSLDRAADWALALGRPLVILEPLRCDYPWASDRLHRFILDGMSDQAAHFKKTNVFYYPYVEPKKGAGKGLLSALSKRACVIITDDFPCFFLPRMVGAAASRLEVRLEQVDSNGLLPLLAADQTFETAYAFRRFLQKTLSSHLFERPREDPLKGVKLNKLHCSLKELQDRWPPASQTLLGATAKTFGRFPIDHGVKVAPSKGGFREAKRLLLNFVDDPLSRYHLDRNEPEKEGTSNLSPYLHFGHVSVHQIFDRVMAHENWFFDRISAKATGSRSGWWGMSEAAEAFLDQLITWRELGFNMCSKRHNYDQYESLPPWAVHTLRDHRRDGRHYLYDLEAFEAAATHDPLWNSAQMQLVREGRIHNTLRMLWGKKILEWSKSPQKALRIMIELNNKYGLDGRDPNSYSGIFWVLGRYDRPWGPERPVFGKIRYMSSENTARKVDLKNYVKRYAPRAGHG